MSSRARGRLAILLLLLACFTPPLSGQGPGQASPAGRGVLLGAHIGLDYLFDGFVVGGQGHFILDPWGVLDLMPNGEAEFRQGITDWQLNADLAVQPIRGLYLGGGAAFRNTIYRESEGRETRRGYSVFAGVRPPGSGLLRPQLEMRWTVVGGLRPRVISVGVNFPLLSLP